ncbi:hypothetical protein GQ53DRAFT_764453 [Thozetella sp. PMI_491]|nr:hypothetical protein GQ53DRAFT_764453 [Thozetella sp. PMI_491]
MKFLSAIAVATLVLAVQAETIQGRCNQGKCEVTRQAAPAAKGQGKGQGKGSSNGQAQYTCSTGSCDRENNGQSCSYDDSARKATCPAARQQQQQPQPQQPQQQQPQAKKKKGNHKRNTFDFSA